MGSHLRRSVWMVFCLVVSLFGCVASRAQSDPKCTFSASNISFGTVDLSKGNPYDAAGTFTYVCTGDSREIVRICPSWGLANDGTRWLTDSSGDKLFYNLYSDADRHTVWGSWYSKSVKAPTIDVPIGRGERVSGSVPVYARITANQQAVPSGAYNGTMNKGNAAVSYGYARKGSCESMKGGSRTSVGLSVSANVGGAAVPGAITAPDATKGSAAPGVQPNGAQVNSGQPAPHRSLMEKLADNAKYQEEQREKDAASSTAQSGSATSAEDRAKYLETHACLTTDGADKANQLADECNRVTDAPHKGCNVQENSCEEIRKVTQKGCWGLAASAPDFCLTKYR